MKSYCTQNNGDCQTCSLTNYGRDCQNQPIEKKNTVELTYDEIWIVAVILKRILDNSFYDRESESYHTDESLILDHDAETRKMMLRIIEKAG